MGKEILGVKLYTYKEAGELLGVLSATIAKYVKEGRLPSQLIGGRYYISEQNLKEFLLNK